MDSKQSFKKYYSRLVLEGIIKAVICGFIVAFAAILVSAFVTFLADYNGLWLLIGIGFGIAAACSPLFYFFKFRPTAKKVAERVDRLGLEERVITMLELQKDDSYIAMRQREDAKGKLSANRKPLKLSIFKIPVVTLSLLAIFSVSMLTVSTLNAKRLLPGQGDDTKPEELVDIIVTYEADEGGYIEGEPDQLVTFGQDAKTVVAVADEGYMFDQWSDGSLEAERTDTNIREECTFTAMFLKLEDDSKDADQEPNDEPEDGDPTQGGDPGPVGPGIIGDDGSKILDGNTEYREVYQQYYEQAMQKLAEGGQLTDAERAMIEAYWGILV